jgi:hypothetical protein
MHVKNFNVLLTVLPDIIIASLYQAGAHIFISNTPITFLTFLYMFRKLLCSSSGGQIVYSSVWFHHSGNKLVVRITKICSLLQRPQLNNVQHSQVRVIHGPTGFKPVIPKSGWAQTDTLVH